MACQQGRANQHEPACFGLFSPWSFPSLSGVRLRACRSTALAFSAAIHFAMKCYAPCSAVVRHFPSSWAAVVHRSTLMPKALRSSRKHLIHSFSWPPTQPAPTANSPNITHFGSLVSSTRATNPANKISLLRKVASMFSLPVLISVSRYEIWWLARLCFRQPMQRVKNLWWALTEGLWSGAGLMRERWCCARGWWMLAVLTGDSIHGTLFHYYFFVPHIMGILS